MSQRFIVVIVFLLLILSSVFLYWKNQTSLDPNQQKSWWEIAFSDLANPNTYSFFIENHTPDQGFHYQLSSENSIFFEEDIIVQPGENRLVSIPTPPEPGRLITITVLHEGESRTLYR